MDIATPVGQLNRVGKTVAGRLGRLGVRVTRDLLYYFPFRYEDFSRVAPIAELREGESVTARGKIEIIASKRTFRKRKMVTEAIVTDISGSVRVVWFNQPYITKILKPGDEIFLSGKVTRDMLGPQFVSPSYEKANKETTTHTARLVPIYPVTEGLTQKQIRFLVSQVLPLVKEEKEWLPAEILEKFDLAPLTDALQGIHFPADEANLKQSTERLKFDELFLLQLKAEMARKNRLFTNAPTLKFKEKEVKDFVSTLPFILTKTQKISAWEILQDMEKSTPMNRLLSGDVGSGKTVVAAMAMYDAVLNNYQAVLMAPTEILAFQHYNSLRKLLGDKLKIGLRTNSKWEINGYEYKNCSSVKQKKEFLEKLKKGELDLMVGTHALLSEGVDFQKLGLVIVDEQHRFGVEQRKTIKEKGEGAHFLSMTATPIPRSLGLMIYGDLDMSIINEMPSGRKKIITRFVEPMNRQRAYNFIHEQIKKGRQAFVVCPLIEEKDASEIINYKLSIINYSTDDKRTVMSEYKKLSEKIFADLKIGFLHGKMKSKEKDEIMNKFRNREIDILVSTSVVEVGVDIPNASVMMIEGAERFGLAQLHQFRGRVGRAEHQSYCLLFAENLTQKSEERLRYFEKNNDGFKLAEKDLEMRGPGEVYGHEQSGMMNLRLARLTDREIIKKTREAALLVSNNFVKFPLLLNKVNEWESEVHLE